MPRTLHNEITIGDACPVCGNNRWKPIFEVQDTNQDVYGSWWILVCLNCGLGCLVPTPSTDEVQTFYGDQFYTEDRERFAGWLEVLRGHLARRRVVLIERYLPQPGRFLDFGSGPGHFGKILQKSGWEVENEDISYEKGESRLIMNGHLPVLDYPDDYFDAVSLWYVIEHMVDPHSTLNEIKRVLRPSGVLILSQQNFDSIQAKLFGPCWLILDPPRHVYQFSPSNLCMLAEQHGYQKIGIEHSCLEMGPFTILQSTLNKLLGNGNYLFKLLKNRKLQIKAVKPEERERIILLGASSIVLSAVLAPLSMLAYHILLRTGSGDVFTLALKNQGH